MKAEEIAARDPGLSADCAAWDRRLAALKADSKHHEGDRLCGCERTPQGRLDPEGVQCLTAHSLAFSVGMLGIERTELEKRLKAAGAIPR